MLTLAALSFSLTDQALAVAGQIALTVLGSTYSDELATAFKNANDTFTRPAESVAWLRYVDRPPFNLITFDHWHFHPLPYNTTGGPVLPNLQEDDLQTALIGSSSLLTELQKNALNRPWTWAFAAKVVLGAIVDSLSPLHTTELFSSDFPNGDNSGRAFTVVYGGQRTTLFKAWESGCGTFSDNLTFGLSDWVNIENMATTLMSQWPRPATKYSAQTAIAESHVFDTTVTYAGLKPGATLPSAYIANCSAQTRKNVAYAGYAIADVFSGIRVPTGGKRGVEKEGAGVRGSEVASWVVMGTLAPVAGYLLWRVIRKN
jgi:hypothetical protein